MKIEKIEINKLKPATYNPRQITKKQYNELKDSIDKFGLVDPIVVNQDMTIIGGHQRYKIWKENAEQSNVDDITIPCVVLNLNKEQERELNIRLNKSGGEFDIDILANEFNIDELIDWGFKHVELGLNLDKIQKDLSDQIELQYKIEVEVTSEKEQETLYNDLTKKGYICRILTL